MDQERSVKKELTVEELTAEAMKLRTIGLDELYVVLGCQLLGTSRPARVAGIMSYQTALKKVMDGQSLYESHSVEPNLIDWAKGFGFMYEELKHDGIRFFDSVKGELQGALCNEEILALADEITASSMQIIV